jgi:hypothetical protein
MFAKLGREAAFRIFSLEKKETVIILFSPWTKKIMSIHNICKIRAGSGSVAHDVRVTSIHPVGVSIGHSPCFGPARLMP